MEDIRYEKHNDKSTKRKVTDEILWFNGIDRIDSKIGYIDGNVVTCCKHCNFAKDALTQKEFKDLIFKIYNHWAKPNRLLGSTPR